jgi:predicted glycogen debranching enzyme
VWSTELDAIPIHLGHAIAGDPAWAEQREWLITNGLGSYGCGTVTGSRTRSYHGLLVAALGAPADPATRTLLVAGLEDSVHLDGPGHTSATPLWSQRWLDGRLEPPAATATLSVQLEGTIPCWRYAIGDALLEKRLWMEVGAHTTYVHYQLLQASRPLRLEITILVNPRCHHGAADPAPIQIQTVPRGVRLESSSAAIPPFTLRSDRGRCSPLGPEDWCHGMALAAERERGLPWTESLLRVCRFEVELQASNPSATLVLSLNPEAPLNGAAALAARRHHDEDLLRQWQNAEPQLAAQAPRWVRQLVLAADAFLVSRDDGAAPGTSVIAGYPWFGDWGRDTMISLSGLTLATGRAAIGARILRTYARHLSRGMLPNRFPDGGEPLSADDYNTVDATLWFVEALRRQLDATDDLALLQDLWPCLQMIIAAHCQGTRHGIGLDPNDALLRAGASGTQLTWMDAKVNGEVITPRIGKPVEVNALWCRALESMAHFAALIGDGDAATAHAALAERARCGFQRFWNPAAGCCFDVLDGPDGSHDDAVRPNQLLAVALSDRLLDSAQSRQLLAICEQRLLTPMGLRSLDPADRRYQGHYGGDPLARDRAYHQGTVWAWWLGPWAIARARLHGSAQPALQWLEAIADHLAEAGLGSVSEIFDGDPPHAPRGCIAQAWSVAELLRAWTELMAMTPDSPDQHTQHTRRPSTDGPTAALPAADRRP